MRRRPRVHRAGRCQQAHHPHREPAGPPGACRGAAVLRDPVRLRQSRWPADQDRARQTAAPPSRSSRSHRRPDATPIERGNLRTIRYTPGASGGDQPELVRTYDYLAGFGCTCGQAFVTRETDPRGGVRSTEYDDRGNPVLIVDRDGSRTKLSYNAFGDLSSRSPGGRTPRHLRVLRPARAAVRRDSRRRRPGPDRPPTNTDELGRLTLLRDPAGHEHRHAWNAWDLMVRRTASAPDRISTDDTRYDAEPQPDRQRGPGGRPRAGRQTRTYDRLRRLRTVSRPARVGARGRPVPSSTTPTGIGWPPGAAIMSSTRRHLRRARSPVAPDPGVNLARVTAK